MVFANITIYNNIVICNTILIFIDIHFFILFDILRYLLISYISPSLVTCDIFFLIFFCLRKSICMEIPEYDLTLPPLSFVSALPEK